MLSQQIIILDRTSHFFLGLHTPMPLAPDLHQNQKEKRPLITLNLEIYG